jgi:PAS domain S-box-containing protein
MLGYSVDEWLQNPNFWQRIIHDDDCERMQRELKEIFDSGRRGVSRFRWVSKAGNALWVEAQSFVIKDSDENPIGMRGVVMDITERMEREERKDEFISMASHELRTPLTSIKVLTQVLRTKANTKDNEFLNYVEKINDQIFKLEHLVNDLLDVSKVQQGYLNLNKEKFNLYRLVEDVVESMQLVNPIHQISLKGNNNTRVYADKNRISQVIINLLTNAIKYSPNSTKIKINLEQEDGEISISVQDYGMGIPKKHLNRVFDRFYRVLDDKDKTYPGFGMGLYISREIIQRHGGNISVVSQVGKGSTFSFSLPVIDKNEKIVSS